MIYILIGMIAVAFAAAAILALYFTLEHRRNIKRANEEEQKRLNAGVSLDDWWRNKK